MCLPSASLVTQTGTGLSARIVTFSDANHRRRASNHIKAFTAAQSHPTRPHISTIFDLHPIHHVNGAGEVLNPPDWASIRRHVRFTKHPPDRVTARNRHSPLLTKHDADQVFAGVDRSVGTGPPAAGTVGVAHTSPPILTRSGSVPVRHQSMAWASVRCVSGPSPSSYGTHSLSP
jgi:hypothetical protein